MKCKFKWKNLISNKVAKSALKHWKRSPLVACVAGGFVGERATKSRKRATRFRGFIARSRALPNKTASYAGYPFAAEGHRAEHSWVSKSGNLSMREIWLSRQRMPARPYRLWERGVPWTNPWSHPYNLTLFCLGFFLVSEPGGAQKQTLDDETWYVFSTSLA